MDCSTPGLPVHHQFPELSQTHVHQVSDAIQPSPSAYVCLTPFLAPECKIQSGNPGQSLPGGKLEVWKEIVGGQTCSPPGFNAMFSKLQAATAHTVLSSIGCMRWASLRNPVGYNTAEGTACSEQQPCEETLICVCVCVFACARTHMLAGEADYMSNGLEAYMVKNLPSNARDQGSIPGSGRSPGEGTGNPLQSLSGESHGQRSLPDFSLWDHKESGTADQLTRSAFHPLDGGVERC